MEATETITPATETPSSTAPAATAPTTVSSEPAKETRPTSMRAAFERMEAKSKEVATAPGPATTRPAATPPTGQDPTKPLAADAGPMPIAQHKAILENARKELTTYKEKHGWAEKVPQQTFQEVASFLTKLRTDPIGYATDLISQIEAHPQYGPQWKARQGNGNGRGQVESFDPDVEILDPATGKPLAQTFSAERQKALLKHELAQAIKPFQTEREQREEAARQQKIADATAAHQRQVEAQTNAQWEDLKGILEITDDKDPLLADVLATWEAHQDWTPHRVALEVRKTKVTPRQQGQAVHAAETEMRRKAAGNTVTSTGQTAIPTRPKTREQLRQWMEDKAASFERA